MRVSFATALAIVLAAQTLAAPLPKALNNRQADIEPSYGPEPAGRRAAQADDTLYGPEPAGRRAAQADDTSYGPEPAGRRAVMVA